MFGHTAWSSYAVPWVQNYNPLGSVFWSTAVAGSPIVLLLGLLACGVRAPWAALAGLVAALLAAIWGFGMPADAALAAAVQGACFGLLPIGWIVVSAVFLFHLTVRAGRFEVVKRSVAALSPDQRMQALLIAFSFGAFLEGAAGFGTPVAISAALLIGLRFTPRYAAGLALLANTSPVAFGALGTPILTLAKVSGLDVLQLSQMAGRQLPLFSLLIPAWLVVVMSGWRGLVGAWPAVLVCGGSFATIQFVTSNYVGPELVDVAGGLGSLVCLTLFLRVWQPREVWTFPNAEASRQAARGGKSPAAAAEADAAHAGTVGHDANGAARGDAGAACPTPAANPDSRAGGLGMPACAPPSRRETVHAWMPWVLLSALVFLWGWPQVKTFLNGGTAERPGLLWGVGKPSWEVPRLHGRVYRTRPVVPVTSGSDRAEKPEEARYEFNWLSATGTAVFLAALISAAWMGLPPAVVARQFVQTVWRARAALATIACMLALAFTTRYSGCDATLGLAFTRSGSLYPFFAPLLGWLGVALTGSDTSSNALFGSLQRITAEQLGLNPVLMAAANSTGGVMGKMIDAQSIVVAAVATEQHGKEGEILRFVLLHSVLLAMLVGLLTLAQAYGLPWMIPS
jgi:lactate permease